MYMFFETYAQAAASLAYIRQITHVTCQLVDSPFIVGWCVVSGWFYPISYSVAAFIFRFVFLKKFVILRICGEMYVKATHFFFFLSGGEMCFVLCSI